MQLSTLLRVGAMALRRMHVPLYQSKFSKRTFTVHQHLLMQGVKELEKATYRGLVERLEDSKAVEEHLGLERIPHFTTPQKFLQRVPKAWLRLLLKRMVDLLASDYHLAADATCYSLRTASTHYLQRLGQEVEVRDTLKAVDLLEVVTGLFVASKGIPGHRHEAPHLVPSIRRLPRTREVYGDKAFDGEAIHRELQGMGVEGYIDVKGGRNTPSHGLRKRVAVFKEAHPEAWAEKRALRVLIESSYHALKAVTGDVLPGRRWWTKDRYRAIKYFAYNLYVLARDHLEEVLSLFLAYGVLEERGFLQTPERVRFIYNIWLSAAQVYRTTSTRPICEGD